MSLRIVEKNFQSTRRAVSANDDKKKNQQSNLRIDHGENDSATVESKKYFANT